MKKQAFTLVEMLVVISILGLLAGLTVPAIKSFAKANTMAAADRQLLDEVGHARQLAMSRHSTVYMIFVPTNFWGSLNPADLATATNLLDKQLTGYAFLSSRTVGDQPGQHHWQYLSSWQALPENVFIESQKFSTNLSVPFAISRFHYANNIPFPNVDSTNATPVPYIAFDYLGQLTVDGKSLATGAELIPLARGTVSPAINPVTKALQFGNPSISETPPGNSTNSAYNIVAIEPITGRATLLYQKVQ